MSVSGIIVVAAVIAVVAVIAVIAVRAAVGRRTDSGVADTGSESAPDRSGAGDGIPSGSEPFGGDPIDGLRSALDAVTGADPPVTPDQASDPGRTGQSAASSLARALDDATTRSAGSADTERTAADGT